MLDRRHPELRHPELRHPELRHPELRHPELRHGKVIPFPATIPPSYMPGAHSLLGG